MFKFSVHRVVKIFIACVFVSILIGFMMGVWFMKWWDRDDDPIRVGPSFTSPSGNYRIQVQIYNEPTFYPYDPDRIAIVVIDVKNQRSVHYLETYVDNKNGEFNAKNVAVVWREGGAVVKVDGDMSPPDYYSLVFDTVFKGIEETKK
ncbi:MAG: hypothetical protein ACRC5C_11280 [Bacilli bacterium]